MPKETIEYEIPEQAQLNQQFSESASISTSIITVGEYTARRAKPKFGDS